MQQDQDSQRNLVLAIALSIGVLLGWQFLYAGPRQAAQQEQTRIGEAQKQQTKPGVPGSGTPGVATPPGTVTPSATPTVQPTLTRAAALAERPQIPIETALVKGSINLRGALVDDLVLTKYREQLDPSSPAVVLLSPATSPQPYFAEFGWLVPQGSTVVVPGSDTVWTAQSKASLTPQAPAVLTYDNGQGLLFRRTISIDDSYMFTVKDEVDNKSGKDATLVPYGRLYRFGTPKVEGWAILHEGVIGWIGEERLQEFAYADLTKEGDKLAKTGKPNEYTKLFKPATGGWLGFTDKYWSAVLVPPQDKVFDSQFATIGKTAGRNEIFYTNFQLAPQTVVSGATGVSESRLFGGAKQPAIVDGYRDSLGIKGFDLMVDWGMFHWFTKPLFKLIHWLYGIFGNFGAAILAVTVLVKGAFFPLQNKSYQSMAKMKKLQPEMERIRKDYADDKARQQQAMMELYKKEKINPAAGCLPVLLQFPVFFALYKVLFISIDMRHAPFIGWIKDLSAPDPTSLFNLFGLLPFGLPDFLQIGVWPIIMGATMWMQFQLNPPQPDPTQQMVFQWMPVMLTFMMGTMPAGLIIYWSWSNILSFAQQYYINKANGADIHVWKNLGIEKWLGRGKSGTT